MPEWNLVAAKETEQAHYVCSKLALPKLTAAYCLVLAVVFATQVGCTKLRSGGMDRNILRSGAEVPSQQTQPASSSARFSNNPTSALLELNEVYEEFEGAPFDETKSDESELNQEFDFDFDKEDVSQSQLNDAKIVGVTEQSFSTDEREIKLVAIQPPAPSITDSFEAVEAESSTNIERVLLGGVPLSEIEPINPAKVIAQCDHKEHAKCDCMKEKLKPVLPFAQPVQPSAIPSQAPPSELVSQPLAPIMFDETTREVEAFDEERARQNMLRLVAQSAAEEVAPIEEKLETNIVLKSNDFVNAEAIKIDFHPTVDPELGRANRSNSGCIECDSLSCAGDCAQSNRRDNENQLRPIVMSEEIPVDVAGTRIAEFQTEFPTPTEPPQERAPISIEGEFVAHQMPALERTDYTEFTTQDWIEIFGPAPAPVKAVTTTKSRRSDFQPKVAVIPPTIDDGFINSSESQFLPDQTNDFAPNDQNKVELVDMEVEATKWEPPTHTNFSPIPATDRAQPAFSEANSLALEKAALRAHRGRPFPVVDTRVEIPAKPEVVVEIVDNTVPWSVKLAETIDNVRRQRNAESDPMARNGIEVNLRLLEVLQRQMVTVEENRHSMPNGELQYWQHQLDAIGLMLPATNDGISDLDRHNTAYETLEHLRKAVERLESIAELKVLSGRFCTEISGFGKYKPFANTVFKANQKTLVYCEVENYNSHARVVNAEQSYHTRLRGSYVVYDQQGRVVQQSEYPVVEDVARKKRRDFYMYFPIQIGDLTAGNYRLELMVEDLGSNKSAALKPGMAFQVR